jgi:hypothetical protein
MPKMLYYEYNLRNRCTTRDQLAVEEAQIRRCLVEARTDEQRAALGTRLAIVRRVLEELNQTTLAL